MTDPSNVRDTGSSSDSLRASRAEARGSTRTDPAKAGVVPGEIRRVVRRTAWRLWLIDVLRTTTITVTGAITLVLALRIADAFLLLSPDWAVVFAAAAGAAVVAGAAWAALRAVRGIDAARVIDEHAGLRESLSTALCVAGDQDPWARVVVETARERAVGVKVSKAIPVRAPRLAPLPLAAATALVVVWFTMPEHFSWTRAAAIDRAEREVIEVKAEVKAQDEALAKALERANVTITDAEEEAEKTAGEPRSADEVRRDQMRRLTKIEEQLANKSESAQLQLQAMKDLMRQVRQPGPGPLDEVSKALQKGDFAKAQEKLEELAKKAADGALDEKQAAQLKDQLSKLSQQLDQLSEARKELEAKLAEAGLTADQAAQAAKDPQSLENALKNLQNLTEAQKQQLKDAAQSLNSACKNCQGMSQSMSKMASGLSEQGLSQEGMEGLAQLGDQLSELEMMDAQLASMKAAMSECKGQLASLGQCMGDGQGKGQGQGKAGGLGEWKPGDSSTMGNGSGGPGKGNGLGPESEQAAFNTNTEKSTAHLGAGPVIGQQIVYGEQIRGASTQGFVQAVEVAGQQATEAVVAMQVPPELTDAVKSYFGRLEQRAKVMKGEAPVPPSADGSSAEPSPAETQPADGTDK